jgi:hypothetical protein
MDNFFMPNSTPLFYIEELTKFLGRLRPLAVIVKVFGRNSNHRNPLTKRWNWLPLLTIVLMYFGTIRNKWFLLNDIPSVEGL